MKFRAFVLGVFGVTASYLLLALLLNYLIDPARLFHEGLESGAARILAARGNVAFLTNFDERLLQKQRLESESTHKVDWIVVGSSRAMEVAESMLGGQLINLSVSAASIEDLASLLKLGTDRLNPGGVVIGIDPWLFNGNSGRGPSTSLMSEYVSAMAELAQTNNVVSLARTTNSAPDDRYLQLVSLAYLRASVRFVLSGGLSKQLYFRQDDTSASDEWDVVRQDGSRQYNRSMTGKTQNAVEADALREGRPPVYLFDSYRELDNHAKAIFEALVAHYRSRRAVALLLSPYHPTTYSMIAKGYPQLAEVEALVRKVARKYDVPVLGSYDPERAGCTRAEFFDGMHPKPSCIGRVMSKLGEVAVRP